ncbi:MAG TPA: substrate-binding domain-containing protein [Jiangellaceae bacterium]|nr:substrate-binding domain-containing protein [Jiangellaceae bacterium]
MAPRHRARRPRSFGPVAVALALVAVAATAGVVAWSQRDPDAAAETTDSVPNTAGCETTLRIVTARSFAPALSALAPSLQSGDNCANLQVEVVDGRAAPAQVVELEAHVWIPDDAAWAETAGSLELAEEEVAGSGTVVATSPIYMVTDETTANKVADAGGSWEELADLVTSNSGVNLVVRDPAGSGDGLIGIGSVGEAVWHEYGMDASAEALAEALPNTETVANHALPEKDGDVGLVCEYALIRLLENPNREAAAGVRNAVLLTGSDHTAQLRYTWLPTAAAAEDPALAGPLERLLSVLTSNQAAEALAGAGLRRPDGGPPPGATSELMPEVSAAPFEVLSGHAVDHVFATWYESDRRSAMLVVVDVSGSMANPPNSPLIDVVAKGVLAFSRQMPDEAELGLWEFASLLDPPRDYRVLVPRAPLDDAQRPLVEKQISSLDASANGTGLYDTILAAYQAAQRDYRDGVANHVIVFTDGKNEDDLETISIKQLTAGLVATQDEERPIDLTVVLFGPEPDKDLLEKQLEPVDASVEALDRPAQVRPLFIHLAAGGVHH